MTAGAEDDDAKGVQENINDDKYKKSSIGIDESWLAFACIIGTESSYYLVKTKQAACFRSLFEYIILN